MKIQLTALVVALSLAACAQTAKKPDAKKPKPAATSSAPDAALMQKVADAWGTLDPDKVAKYYSQAPNNVFFDISPLKYTGWQQYAEGVKKVFADYKSAKFTLKDTQMHPAGSLTWVTTTWDATFERKNGKKDVMNGRWTAIWEKQGGNWLIVHDHFSVPTP